MDSAALSADLRERMIRPFRRKSPAKQKGFAFASLTGIAICLTFYPCPALHANTGRSTFVVSSATRVILPPDFHWKQPERRYTEGHGARLDLYSRSFRPGDAIYAEVRLPAGVTQSRLSLDGEELPLTRTSWGYRTFFAVPSNFRARHMELRWTVPELKLEKFLALRPESVNFPVSTTYRKLPPKRPAAKTPPAEETKKRQEQDRKRNEEFERMIAEQRSIKARVFALRSRDRVESALSHPRDHHHITSPIFVRRVQVFYRMEKGRKNETGRSTILHNGVDLRGVTGAPIFAMLDGQVVLAQRMHYEGNYTVLDHGNGMFTGYMHQSRYNVTPGQNVKAGDKIGEVGTTGFSTGPHLHVSLTIRGVAADPLSLLTLPVRK